jgi:hypothetical protein
MREKILFGLFLSFYIFMLGFSAGEFYYNQTYTKSREHTELELRQLRNVLIDAQTRSDTAIRDLDEAVQDLETITDRNKRVEHLIAAIRATVVQLRAIYEKTGDTISVTVQGQGPMETSNNR